MFLDGIRSEGFTDRFAGRAAIGEVKATVVFGAFDQFSDDQSFGQVSAAVSADSVGGVEQSFIVAVNGKGLVAMVETNDGFVIEYIRSANFELSINGLAVGSEAKAFTR